jgi:DNA-binding SARP family transcriptional activator
LVFIKLRRRFELRKAIASASLFIRPAPAILAVGPGDNSQTVCARFPTAATSGVRPEGAGARIEAWKALPK